MIETSYLHTRDNLKETLKALVFQAPGSSKETIAIIGQVGLVLAERLEAIVNVLEEMEKRL